MAKAGWAREGTKFGRRRTLPSAAADHVRALYFLRQRNGDRLTEEMCVEALAALPEYKHNWPWRVANTTENWKRTTKQWKKEGEVINQGRAATSSSSSSSAAPAAVDDNDTDEDEDESSDEDSESGDEEDAATGSGTGGAGGAAKSAGQRTDRVGCATAVIVARERAEMLGQAVAAVVAAAAEREAGEVEGDEVAALLAVY